MNYVFGNAVVGLPGLIGVILGLKLYAEGKGLALIPTILLVGPLAALFLARSIMHKYPRVGWVLIEFWVLSAVAVTAFATAFVTWISLDTPMTRIFDTSSLNPEQLKTISAAFVAAVSTYVALVWTKDIGDAKGVFWPSTQFKKAMNAAYQKFDKKPEGISAAFQAIYQDTVEGHGNIGWGFNARKIRAGVLADFIGAN